LWKLTPKEQIEELEKGREIDWQSAQFYVTNKMAQRKDFPRIQEDDRNKLRSHKVATTSEDTATA
jgi:hypothetical protein